MLNQCHSFSYGNASLYKVEPGISPGHDFSTSTGPCKVQVSSCNGQGRRRGRGLCRLSHEDTRGNCQASPRPPPNVTTRCSPGAAEPSAVHHLTQSGYLNRPPSPGILGPSPASNYTLMKQKPGMSSRPGTRKGGESGAKHGDREGTSFFLPQTMSKPQGTRKRQKLSGE